MNCFMNFVFQLNYGYLLLNIVSTVKWISIILCISKFASKPMILPRPCFSYRLLSTFCSKCPKSLSSDKNPQKENQPYFCLQLKNKKVTRNTPLETGQCVIFYPSTPKDMKYCLKQESPQDSKNVKLFHSLGVPHVPQHSYSSNISCGILIYAPRLIYMPQGKLVRYVCQRSKEGRRDYSSLSTLYPFFIPFFNNNNVTFLLKLIIHYLNLLIILRGAAFIILFLINVICFLG